jgi:hypothetical protein
MRFIATPRLGLSENRARLTRTGKGEHEFDPLPPGHKFKEKT